MNTIKFTGNNKLINISNVHIGQCFVLHFNPIHANNVFMKCDCGKYICLNNGILCECANLDGYELRLVDIDVTVTL